MRTFFMVLGAASVVFGGYLLVESKRTRCSRSPGASSRRSPSAGAVDAAGITSGPTEASAASTTPVNNDTPVVQQYDGGKSKFPPMTYIMPAGTDWGTDPGTVYQSPIF